MTMKWLLLLMLFVHNCVALGLYDDIDGYTSSDCKKDILILWDNSNSITSTKFTNKVIPFLKKLVDNAKLNVAKEGTHLGFITFSTKERTKTILPIGNKTEADELKKWLGSLNYDRDLKGTRTYTGKAFGIASTETFKLDSPKNHRPETEDVVMLFTDGKPNPSTQKSIAETFSTELKNKKVKIIGLAVGKEKNLINKDLRKNIVVWSSWPEEKYVFKAGIENLEDIVDNLVGPLCEVVIPVDYCFCNKPQAPFTVYAEPGQRTGRAFWPKQKPSCSNNVVPTPSQVNPPGAVSGGRFSLGKHVITYQYSYNDAGKTKVLECPIEFTVVPCECPTTQTIKAKVKPGDTTVDLSWQEPSPSCPTTPSQNNPKTSESFSVGDYTRTYKYTHSIPGLHSFVVQCQVKIGVTACKCPATQTVKAKPQPGDTQAMVSWTEPTPSCTATPMSGNPSSTRGLFSVGQHKRTYRYMYADKLTSFQIRCHVNIIVTGEFCGNTTFDPATHVCCCGQIHQMKPEHVCCGLKYYNTREKSCCNPERAIVMDKCPAEA